jgi:hypothetical protein
MVGGPIGDRATWFWCAAVRSRTVRDHEPDPEFACGRREGPPEPAAAWTVKHGDDGPAVGARKEVRQGAPVRERDLGVGL